MTKMTNLTDAQRMRVEEMKRMTPQEWDTLCKNCGICCLCKTSIASNTIYLSKCCQYLNKETKQCDIYPNRLHRRGANCAKVTLDIVLDGQLVPRTCGYVEYIYGPAPEKINLDWSIVTNYEPGVPMTVKDFIEESVLWNHR